MGSFIIVTSKANGRPFGINKDCIARFGTTNKGVTLIILKDDTEWEITETFYEICEAVKPSIIFA